MHLHDIARLPVISIGPYILAGKPRLSTLYLKNGESPVKPFLVILYNILYTTAILLMVAGEEIRKEKIMKILGKYLLIMVSILILTLGLLNCNEAKSKKAVSPAKVGGPCDYVAYPGTATITRIEKTEKSSRQAKVSGGAGYEGDEVWFVFKTDQEVKEERARKYIEKEHLFLLSNSWYPGSLYLEKYDVKVDSSYPCILSVIKKGTCTPIVFKFTELRRDDYFESSKKRKRED